MQSSFRNCILYVFWVTVGILSLIGKTIWWAETWKYEKYAQKGGKGAKTYCILYIYILKERSESLI